MSTKALKQRTLQSPTSAPELLPTDKESYRILQERADFLATTTPDPKENKKSVSYIKFHLGEHEWYGIPYYYAKEVIRNIPPTKIPFVPHYIVGVINRHGALITVFDLKQRLNLQSSINENNHIILVTSKNTTVGFLVDHIEGADIYDPTALDTHLTSGWMAKSQYIIGLHQGIIAILNVETLLSDVQIN
jgi:chemotaxis signal transduction protein